MGDRIHFTDEQTAEVVFIFFEFLALCGFFLSTISGASVVIFSSFLTSDAEFLAYAAQCGYLWKLALGTFFLGFFSYITGQLWLLSSLLGPTFALSLAAPGLGVMCVVLFGFAHSAQALHKIRSGLMKPEATPSQEGAK